MEASVQQEKDKFGLYFGEMDSCLRSSSILYSRLFEYSKRIVWQTEDQRPKYPRITEFLDYWDKNIDGPIKEVFIYDHNEHNVRKVDRRFKIN